MINFFTDENVFDIEKFLADEKLIMELYEQQEEVDMMNETEFINRFTLYEGHILDELKEVSDAYLDLVRTDKRLEGKVSYYYKELCKEIADVAMYMGSVANLLEMKAKSLIMRSSRAKNLLQSGNSHATTLYEMCFKGEGVLTKEVQKPIYKYDLKSDDNFERFLEFNCNVTNKLSQVRELFPQRKWHKPFVPFASDEEYLFALSKGFIVLVRGILEAVAYLTDKCGELDLASYIINIKTEKIITNYKTYNPTKMSKELTRLLEESADRTTWYNYNTADGSFTDPVAKELSLLLELNDSLLNPETAEDDYKEFYKNLDEEYGHKHPEEDDYEYEDDEEDPAELLKSLCGQPTKMMSEEEFVDKFEEFFSTHRFKIYISNFRMD